MTTHSHQFVEHYEGLLAFGLDRQTDERTLACYLQKFSDDQLLKALLPRLDEATVSTLYNTINSILREHLTHDEYHRIFLKTPQNEE